jgi:hypothetical protein
MRGDTCKLGAMGELLSEVQESPLFFWPPADVSRTILGER